MFCSTATRTRETWQRAQPAAPSAAEVGFERGIYHAWVPELVGLLRQTPDAVSTLLMLGPRPGIPDLVEHLCVRTDLADWAQLDQQVPDQRTRGDQGPRSVARIGKGRAELASFTVPRG